MINGDDRQHVLHQVTRTLIVLRLSCAGDFAIVWVDVKHVAHVQLLTSASIGNEPHLPRQVLKKIGAILPP